MRNKFYPSHCCVRLINLISQFIQTMSIFLKRKPVSDSVHWWGEEKCERCTNKAYYKASGGALLCGTHSRNAKRSELPKNPNAAAVRAQRLADRAAAVEATAHWNRTTGKKGTVICSKLRMMREPDYVEGFLNVFPNNRHQDRADGFGCASLSPMRLGPVRHSQPGLPDALNIENYHQFNKAFKRDVLAPENVQLKPEFFTMRDAAYRDPVPHRHKYPDDAGASRKPLFSVHLTPAGMLRMYTYQQSRYFYCHQYELLAKQQPDFVELRRKIDDGTNLQIVGYDGYAVTKTLWEHYIDPERPFGHELVLYSLLTIENPEDYPWNRFYRENRALYE